jgi:triosephosphate isomerase (TIM)
MRRPVIVGNWKMYKLLAEAVQMVLDLKPKVVNSRHCDIIVAPPFTALKTINDRLEGSNIMTAGQNVSDQGGQGAFTGEISAEMLRDMGCRYAIVGHSERRQHYHETDALINSKLRASLAAGLKPIMCVGENLGQREANEMEAVVGRQVREGLAGLTGEDLSRILVAYEPVWAIGTGRTATPEIATTMHRFIRSVIAQGWGEQTSVKMQILYGGSVKPDNIATLMSEADIDGALVGGASLEADSFARIVNFQ